MTKSSLGGCGLVTGAIIVSSANDKSLPRLVICASDRERQRSLALKMKHCLLLEWSNLDHPNNITLQVACCLYYICEHCSAFFICVDQQFLGIIVYFKGQKRQRFCVMHLKELTQTNHH